jgi:cell wall-associated NlpC family hydrolase
MIPGDAGVRLCRPCLRRTPWRPGARLDSPWFLAVCGSAVIIAGCGAASPRYRTPERPPQVQTQTPPHDDDETRFAEQIREEEAHEDDRKVDASVLRSEAGRLPDSVALNTAAPGGMDRDRVLLDVVGYLGTPYRHGGMTKQGIDCSGFTAQVYNDAVQLHLPRSTAEQFEAGTEVEKEHLRFGDLVFFNTTGHVPSHVGIYIEDDLFAHASVTAGVTISSLESTYYRKRFVGAKRVVAESHR